MGPCLILSPPLICFDHADSISIAKLLSTCPDSLILFSLEFVKDIFKHGSLPTEKYLSGFSILTLKNLTIPSSFAIFVAVLILFISSFVSLFAPIVSKKSVFGPSTVMPRKSAGKIRSLPIPPSSAPSLIDIISGVLNLIAATLSNLTLKANLNFLLSPFDIIFEVITGRE